MYYSVDPSIEAKLSKDKLLLLASLPDVQEFVKEADYSFYQALVEVLVPDVLRPIPSKCAALLSINWSLNASPMFI